MENLKQHDLKILPEYYEKVLSREKRFEIRKDDRNFKVSDILNLREYDGENFTGRSSLYIVTYKLDGGAYGLENGYCILSISPYNELSDFADYLIENASHAFEHQDRDSLEYVLKQYTNIKKDGDRV